MNEVKHTPGDRVRRYLAMRAAKPMKQLGDSIHIVNASSEWEGELKLSDLKIFAEQHAEMLEALKRADQFITNGIELGYIRLPSPPDPALETPGIIRATIAKAKGLTP